MISVDIVFDRKKKASSDKKGVVELRVTQDRRCQYMSTGVMVYRGQWDCGQVIGRPDCDELTQRVWAMKKRLEKEVTECVADGRSVVLAEIKDKLSAAGDAAISGRDDLLTWLREQVDDMRAAKGTKNHYWNMLEKLELFGRVKTWTDINVENVYGYDSWLHKLNDGQISDAGVHNYHKCLKALLNRAVECGRLSQNPYERLKGKFKRGDKESVEYLTEEEIQAVRTAEMPKRIYEEARDLFVFQCYTGLAYSDAMAFRLDDYKLVDGRWNARKERIKTGVPYVSVLLSPAVEVVERYGGKVPYINNAEYNQRLKVVGALAGIGTPLHSHLGRHTFATLMLSKGVKIEHVSKMLGHTNITQTQRYAKVLAQDVKKSFEMVDEGL